MVQRGWRGDRRLAPAWQGRRSGADGLRFDILSDPVALAQACAAAEVILCLAGVTPAPGARLEDNAALARAVLEAAEGRPVLLTSSAAVYGRAGGLCREDGPAVPAAPYGQAKIEMERIAAQHGGPVTCLRIGNVAGADQILGRADTGAAMVLDRLADGRTPARSYIGPVTLARVLADLCLVAGSGRALPRLLNVASPGAVEMGALLDAASHPWQPRPAPPDAIAEVVLDTATLNRFIPLDPEAGRAARLVAEWRADLAATETRQ